MLRRDFLKFTALAPLALQLHYARAEAAPRYLVLIELNGGNDGLNTVVPYADELYYRLRPRIALARDQVLQLDERVGLNPALQPLMPLWRDGQLAIVQAVGYPEPNRSHFRSIEIWDTGSDADDYLDSGWLARALPGTTVARGFTADAVVLGRNPRPAMGAQMHTLVVDDIERFARRGQRLAEVGNSTDNPALAHVLEVQSEVHEAAAALLAATQNTPPPPGDFPKTPFGKSLEQTARLILMEHATPVIKLALGSFDTHANQRGQQDRLLGELAQGLSAFRASMQQTGRWNRVLVLSYSEFGRRVADNASAGTDHGSAAAQFVLGGAVRGGLYGAPPNLDRLDAGDVVFQHDFRSLYNTVLKQWWNLPQTPFDVGRYPPLKLI